MIVQNLPNPRFRATMDDVAQKAGVSTATVSRVINDTGPVAPDTRAAVLAAIEALNYRPHSAAQILARKKTNTIGLLIESISGNFFSPLLRGIETAAQENGYNLLIYSTHRTQKTNLKTPLGDNNTDGLLVFVDSLPKPELIRLHHMGFPLVLIHQSPPKGTRIPAVTIENKSGACKIVDHLIEVHHFNRIAHLTGDVDHEDTHWRLAGYRQSLEKHGLPFDPGLVANGGFDQAVASSAVEKWLRNGVAFDAIFAGDDEMAIGALDALENAGLKVPEDIGLVGFDDIYLSRYLSPQLTTVRAPIEKVGHQALRLLVTHIEGDPTENLVLLPTEIVIRQSCGCP